MNFTQQEMGPGVRLYLCPTDKFKTLTCKVFIQQDLQPREAAQTALVPLLLRRGSRGFPPPGISPGSLRICTPPTSDPTF